MVQFVWDDNKNKINLEKHGISFEEAESVFQDDDSVVLFDEEHSGLEERFILIGFSFKARILVVCHCYRENDIVVRIISARKAKQEERNVYLNEK